MSAYVRPPRARWRQAGVVGAKLSFALGTKDRAISWTFNSVADAKWSATASLQVASCRWHTLPAGCRQLASKGGADAPSRAKIQAHSLRGSAALRTLETPE